MKKSKMTPLAKGLIGGDTTVIHGQIEVFLTNYDTIKIIIHRKPYGGGSDVKFSIECADLQNLINVLCEAKKRSDDYWLSRVAIAELKK
jgi:hypothetical protein